MKITDLLEHLDSACFGTGDRKAYLEVTLAAELAWSIALPSMPVANMVQFFEESAGDVVKRVIGEINEMYPISTQVCYNLAVDLYKGRYTILHEPRLLTGEDIARLMCRPAVQCAMTDDHKAALGNNYCSMMRGNLAEFITRYVVPTEAA